jgi:hypothetical protein
VLPIHLDIGNIVLEDGGNVDLKNIISARFDHVC